jgi:outer membrane protein OmpA-like peptidoglycan-associated protein
VFIPGPVSGGAPPHNNGHTIRPVPPVQQAPIAIAPDTTETFTNSSAFGFLPDSDTFRDQAGAQNAATRIAAWLTAGTGRTAAITGTTATAGTEQTRQALSLARANAVANLITAAGAPATTLTTTGAGNYFNGFTPDTDPNGILDPAKAETNRTVQIHYTTH